MANPMKGEDPISKVSTPPPRTATIKVATLTTTTVRAWVMSCKDCASQSVIRNNLFWIRSWEKNTPSKSILWSASASRTKSTILGLSSLSTRKDNPNWCCWAMWLRTSSFSHGKTRYRFIIWERRKFLGKIIWSIKIAFDKTLQISITDFCFCQSPIMFWRETQSSSVPIPHSTRT